MALTRAQIIAEGLSMAGRSDLTSNARLWLNLFLEKIYKTYDWEWLVKDAGVAAISDGGAFPADYWKFKTANLLDASTGAFICEVNSLTPDQYAYRLRGGSVSGTPREVFLNLDARTYHFWPTPSVSYNWRLFYYYLPTLPDHTSGTGDSATPKWGLHDDVLIRAIQLKALYYNDDARYQSEIKELFEEVAAGRMNAHDKRGGFNRIKFGKSYRKRF